MPENKRRWGDRRDGRWIRDVDSLHVIMPYLYPNRADNEAYLQETYDLTELNKYLAKKNEGRTQDKYTLMHAICTALVHTITLRPKLNYFIKGHRIYERNHLSLAFVVKKQFNDRGEEALAFMKFGPETTMDSLHEKIMKEIHTCRSEKVDHSTNAMNIIGKIPRWLLRPIFRILHSMDYHGTVPDALIGTDPNHATVMLSNFGSIGLSGGYHHLSNWGTMSIFVVIGKKRMAPVFKDDGSYEMREVVDIGITLDERIADGYYYAKSLKIVRKLLEHPELLDTRADTEVEV